MDSSPQKNRISEALNQSAALKTGLASDAAFLSLLDEMSRVMCQSLRAGGKILFCGNGGSAADAQHLAAELSGRFEKNRPALYAEAITVNASSLTAISNDFGFDEIFARQVEAFGSKGDVLIAISTSGNSANVLRALEVAKSKGMVCMGLSGESGGRMKALCSHLVCIPSNHTARIQECHITVGHILCGLVEAEMFPG